MDRLGQLNLNRKADIYEGLSQLSEEQISHLKSLNQRRRFLENFKKSKQEDFLRPTEEEKAYISSLISNRKSMQTHEMLNVHKTKEHNMAKESQPREQKPKLNQMSQDLEFGGVGLFGNRPAAFEEEIEAYPDE